MAEYIQSVGDFHGTKVAGQAAYGTDRIKLVDVRVQKGQVDVEDNSENIANGITWAIESQGARIITSSVDINWSGPKIQEVVRANPGVLFLMTTGGNSLKELTGRKIDVNQGDDTVGPVANALLVGGVTMDAKKHPGRGFGSGVDVAVPSGAASDDERAMPVHMPMRSLFKEMKSQGAFGDMQDDQIDAILQQNLATAGDSMVSGESGVSFGIPIVANTAAKMMLINPALTVQQIVKILIEEAVQNQGGALADLSKSGGMLDPVKAYEAAARLRDEAE